MSVLITCNENRLCYIRAWYQIEISVIMRIIKIIIATYIGSNIGFLFGEYVITRIAGENIDLIAVVTTGIVTIPPVLMGLIMSGIIGTIVGASFIKKGKIRAIVGGSGALLGLTIANLTIYKVSAFYKIYYLIYPLFSYSGWELGMYIFKNNIESKLPVKSNGKENIE